MSSGNMRKVNTVADLRVAGDDRPEYEQGSFQLKFDLQLRANGKRKDRFDIAAGEAQVGGRAAEGRSAVLGIDFDGHLELDALILAAFVFRSSQFRSSDFAKALTTETQRHRERRNIFTHESGVSARKYSAGRTSGAFELRIPGVAPDRGVAGARAAMLPSSDGKPTGATSVGESKIDAGSISKRSLRKMRAGGGALVFPRERRDALPAVREERTEHGAAGFGVGVYAGASVRRRSGGSCLFSVRGGGDHDRIDL